MNSLFTTTLPTSLSSLYKWSPSLSVRGLASGSLWLQTLNHGCNSLLILSKWPYLEQYLTVCFRSTILTWDTVPGCWVPLRDPWYQKSSLHSKQVPFLKKGHCTPFVWVSWERNLQLWSLLRLLSLGKNPFLSRDIDLDYLANLWRSTGKSQQTWDALSGQVSVRAVREASDGWGTDAIL